MSKFILKRLGYMLLVLFAVVSITFFLVHSIPGDPITSMVQDLPEETRDAYLARYGFDQPIGVQYVRFLKQLLTGDLGSSLRYPGRKVVNIVKNYAPVSGAVGGIALMIGFTIGIILGIVAALNRNKWSDKVIMVIALLGTTIPTFVMAAVLQYVFTVTFPIFPTTGWGTASHMVLPVACMCLGPIASYARYMRSSVLDVTNQPVQDSHAPCSAQFLPALHNDDMQLGRRHLFRLVHRRVDLRPSRPRQVFHKRHQRPRLFGGARPQYHLYRRLYPLDADMRYPAGPHRPPHPPVE